MVVFFHLIETEVVVFHTVTGLVTVEVEVFHSVVEVVTVEVMVLALGVDVEMRVVVTVLVIVLGKQAVVVAARRRYPCSVEVTMSCSEPTVVGILEAKLNEWTVAIKATSKEWTSMFAQDSRERDRMGSRG